LADKAKVHAQANPQDFMPPPRATKAGSRYSVQSHRFSGLSMTTLSWRKS
jgi:hypothetical protein